MYFFAMALGWKRVPILLILLIFWKNAVGYKGWSSHAVQSNQNWPVHEILSPQGAQSSVLEAPVSGSIPLEEVASNGFAWKWPTASRSQFSLLPKYVEGGHSSSYASMSLTQSTPSSSVSASLGLPLIQQSLDHNTSLLQHQGSFSSSIRDVANPSGLQLGETSSPLSAQSNSSTGYSTSSLSEATYTSQGNSGPQLAGGSSQLVSGLLPDSPHTANSNIPVSSVYSALAALPQGVSQSTSGPSSYSQNKSGSQSRVGTQLSLGSSIRPQGTTSQYAPTFSLGAKVPVFSQYYPATLSGSSQSLSQSSPKWQPSTSRTEGFQLSSTVASQGFQTSVASQRVSQSPSRFLSLSSASQGFPTSATATSQRSSPSQGTKAPSRFFTHTSAASPGQFSSTQAGSGRYSGLSSQSQSASSQYRPGSSAYAKRGSSLLDVPSQATRDQDSYNVYTSSSTRGTGSQLSGSSHVPMQTGSTFTDGSSLQLQGTSRQYASSSVAKVPVYNQAAPSGSSSLNRPLQWQPSTSRSSQGFQTSGTVATQSSLPSQGSKTPSRFSTLTSAASPGQFSSTQAGSGRYSGLSRQSQSASSQYRPGSSAYAKRGFSLLDVPSQTTSDQGYYNMYTSSTSLGAGAQLAGSSHYVPMQTGSTFTDGFSLQLQGTSSQYAPVALDAKAPVYSQAAPSGSSLSLSQLSQLKPSTSRWSKGFQTSDTATSQSSSPFQGSKAPSRFSTLTSAASPGHFSSTQAGSGRYSGLSSQSQSASSQYRPGSSAYAKRGSSLLDVPSQDTSDQGSYNMYTSSTSLGAGAQLAGSSHYVPMQTGGTITDGSSLQLQGTSSQYVPVDLDAKAPVYSQAAASGSSLSLSKLSQLKPSSSRWSQGFQATGTAVSQSNSSPQTSQLPIGSSFMPALGHPLNSVAQSSQPSMLSFQAASGSVILRQKSPGLFAYVQHPMDSVTSSIGSIVLAASQGTLSGQSSDSSVISNRYSSTYSQKSSGYSRPSQSPSASGQYSSSVKG